jgi:hypothetical protein
LFYFGNDAQSELLGQPIAAQQRVHARPSKQGQQEQSQASTFPSESLGGIGH